MLGEDGAEMLSESQAVGRALVSEHDVNLSEPVPEKVLESVHWNPDIPGTWQALRKYLRSM